MGTFDTGTGSTGYASEGFGPGGGVTRIKTGGRGKSGRVIYKKGSKATKTKEEQPTEYQVGETPVKKEEQSSYPEIQRLTKKPEQIRVEVNKQQIEEMNKNINARELGTALIEGRVAKTPEGFIVAEGTPSTEYKPISPEEQAKFTAPKQVNPQETQPITTEVEFESPFPSSNPYPNSMTARKPEPTGKMQEGWAVKINKAFEEATQEFIETTNKPGNEPLILVGVPVKYAYGFANEAIGFGKSIQEIGAKAIGGANIPNLISETIYNTGEAMVEQAGRIGTDIFTGNIPALSEEAGMITAQIKIGEAINTAIRSPLRAWNENILLAEAQLKYNLETYGTTVKPKEVTPIKTDLEIIKKIQSETPSTEISVEVNKVESIQGTMAELGTGKGTTSRGIINVNYAEPEIIPVKELPPPADFYEIKVGRGKSSTENIKAPKIIDETFNENTLTTTTNRPNIKPGEIIVMGEKRIGELKSTSTPTIISTDTLRVKSLEFQKFLQELPEGKTAGMVSVDEIPRPGYKSVEVFTAQVRGMNLPKESMTIYWQQIEYVWKDIQKPREWNPGRIEDMRYRLEYESRKALEGTGADLGVRTIKGGYEIDFYKTLPSGERIYQATIFKPFPTETKPITKPTTPKNNPLENINPEQGTSTILEEPKIKEPETKGKSKKKTKTIIEPERTVSSGQGFPNEPPPSQGQAGFFEPPEYGTPVYVIRPGTEPIIKIREPTTIINPPNKIFPINLGEGKTIIKEPTITGTKNPTITNANSRIEMKSYSEIQIRAEAKPEIKIRSRSKTETKSKIAQSQGSGIIQGQGQSQSQAQAQEQAQAQKQMLKQTSIFERPREIPEKPKELFPTTRREEKNNRESPFIIKVRRKGIFQTMGTEESLPRAISKAENIVENTASASFKLEREGEVITDIMPSKEFRKSKKEKGVMIQKREFRIGTPGEKSEITQKGIWSNKRKKGRRKGQWGF